MIIFICLPLQSLLTKCFCLFTIRLRYVLTTTEHRTGEFLPAYYKTWRLLFPDSGWRASIIRDGAVIYLLVLDRAQNDVWRHNTLTSLTLAFPLTPIPLKTHTPFISHTLSLSLSLSISGILSHSLSYSPLFP